MRKGKVFYLKVLFYIPVFVVLMCVFAQARLIRGVKGRGEAAVVGITPEESQQLALQRARADAIEQAAGIKILGATLVRSSMLAGDFIKTYVRGFIVCEKIKWFPLEQFQPDANSPPIPMYRVEIIADVEVPDSPPPVNFNVRATLNKHIFAPGEKAMLKISASKNAYIAVFNIRADDKIVMLYPDIYLPLHKLHAGEEFCFPPVNSGLNLEMTLLSGRKRVTEAFLIAAIPAEKKSMHFNKYFQSEKLYSVPEFFRIYSTIADRVAETIIPYVVEK